MRHRDWNRAPGLWTALLAVALFGCDGGAVDPDGDGGSPMDGAIDVDTGAGGQDGGPGSDDAGPGGDDAGPGGEDGGAPCPDVDRDGECDDGDPTCNADGSRLACRRVAPACADGTIPEVRDECYTDRCVTWTECATLVGPPECAADADCPSARVCVLGRCEPATCEARPTVPSDDRYYDRFEGTSLTNACTRNEDCVIGGCSGEICAAEIGASTCEGLPYGPTGDCGCVEGQCVWNTSECPPDPVECRTDRECGPGERCVGGACVECVIAPTLAADDPYYDRFEGTGFDNACRTGADCVRGGCSGEVCAGESVITTCEGLPYGPTGDCGCVEGQCIWNELACSSACTADADGDGVCDAEDSDCSTDGSRLTCRRAAPPCATGTVPEVRESCYTDRCVSWADCARRSGP